MIKDTLKIKVASKSDLFEDIILSTGATIENGVIYSTANMQQPDVRMTVQVGDSESKQFRLTGTKAEWFDHGYGDFHIETEWESVNET